VARLDREQRRAALLWLTGRLSRGVVPLAWFLALVFIIVPIVLLRLEEIAAGASSPLDVIARSYAIMSGQTGIRLETPGALLLGLGALLVLFADGYLDARRSGRFSHSLGSVVSALRPSFWMRLRHLPMALRATAILLLALALARPQDTGRRESNEVEGIDIVMVLDMSRSMAAQDMQGTRIDAAKVTISNFVRRRVTDRVGMVVFGREAYTLCPLTLDYTVLQTMIAGLTLGQVDGRGTAIGNAVGTGINRLRRSSANSKVIILVTDGDSNTGNISPDQAAEFAETLGIRIYTILIGTSDQASISTGLDDFGLSILQPRQQFPINPELLQRMADQTGGEYARAASRRELEAQIQRIDQLERSKLEDQSVRYAERFHIPLIIAMLLLGLDLSLRSTRLRRFP